MTNKQRYQRAFLALQTSQTHVMEVTSMKQNTRIPTRRLMAVCAAVIFVVALACTAYAADVGGIQRTVQIWLHGDQTNAILDVREGQYTLTYQDGEEERTMGGGGVAIEADGQERPLTEEELLEELNGPKVEFEEDGTVWVYYKDQAMDITQRFADGVCYVQLRDGDETLYLTVEEEGHYAFSPHGYEWPTSLTD